MRLNPPTAVAFFLSFGIHALLVGILFSPSVFRQSASYLAVEIRKAAIHANQKPPAKKVNLQSIPLPQKNRVSLVNEVSGGTDEISSVLGSALGIQVEYPRLSRILNEQGEVIVEVSPNQPAQISSSSGHVRLDEAALVATRDAAQSGRLTLGKEALKIRYVFRLTEE